MPIVDTCTLSVIGRTAPQPHDTALTAPEIHELLSTERRYLAVAYLKQNGRAEFDELVDWIAAQENGKDVGEISKKERKRVYSTLKQSHLPKLKRAGAIAYDRATGTIEAGDMADAVFGYLPKEHSSILSQLQGKFSGSMLPF